MALYTALAEILGGTWITQVEGDTPEEALSQWAQDLDISEIKDFEEPHKQHLIGAVSKIDSHSHPTLIDGCCNAWVWYTKTQDEELVLVYIVETVKTVC